MQDIFTYINYFRSGALAERNTFQGERCIYNALNDKIRNLLLSYDYSKSTDPLQPWSSHIQSLMHRETPHTADISLLVGEMISFDLHRFFLSLRSPYFLKKLKESPSATSLRLPDKIPVESVRHVLRYLYLGDPPMDLVDPGSVATEHDVLVGIEKISKHLGAPYIWDVILAGHEDRRLARQRFQDELNRTQSQMEVFFNKCILPSKMAIEKHAVDTIQWTFGNPIFADIILRADGPDHVPDHHLASNESFVSPMQYTGRAVLFPVHKAFLIRAPYFNTMFSSAFKEAQSSHNLVVTKINCSPEALEVVIRYMYTEKFNCPLDLALEVLYVADMLLFDMLKGKAASVISNLGSGSNVYKFDKQTGQTIEVEPINIFDVIRAAWDLKIQRLENFAGRYLAYRLEDYIEEDEFAALIKESAERVKDRQETDTIELLDDIRYFLSERFRMRFEDAGLEEIMDEKKTTQQQQQGETSETNGDTVVDAIVSDSMLIKQHEAAEPLLAPADEMDEFDSDSFHYNSLLQKIDHLLDRLSLDA